MNQSARLPTAVQSGSNGPDHEQKWARIKDLQASTDAAAAHVGHLYVTFLLFSLYFAITIGATMHEQLLRGSPVQLPILNVEIPLFGFYWIAPALFVLLHFNLMLQVVLLAQKLHGLDLVIEQWVAPESAREATRGLLHTLPFSQMLIGRHHQPLVRALLYLMIWTTVILLPILLLLAVQVRFLPYHAAWTTMWHRGLVLVDILLICALWLRVFWGRDAWAAYRLRCKRRDAHIRGKTMFLLRRIRRGLRPSIAWLALAVAAVATLVASWLILTFPGNPSPRFGDPMEEALLDPEGWLAALYPIAWRVEEPPGKNEPGDGRPIFLLTKELFGNLSFLARNLEVTKKNFVSAWPTEEQIAEFGKDEAWRNFAIDLHNRDFRYGNFEGSTLAHADLGEANLQGARLRHTNLQAADLSRADLQDADLTFAVLREANLTRTSAQGALFERVDLRDALVETANLPDTNLRSANLEGSNLQFIHVQSSRLGNVNLQGADLTGADFRGTDLSEANFRGAYLDGANFQGADLTRADFKGSYLKRVNFQGAVLEESDLRGVDLREARIWGAHLDAKTRWEHADLRGIDIRPPQQDEIDGWVKEVEEEATSDPLREKLLNILTDLMERPYQSWTPNFPLHVEANILFDPNAAFAKGWAAPLPLEVFDLHLADFLIGLACAEDTSAALTKGISRRLTGHEPGRQYDARLAAALLGESCPPAQTLPVELISRLKRLLQDAQVTSPGARVE